MENLQANDAVSVPVKLLMDRRVPADAIGAYAIGLAHRGDPRALPRLLQEEGRLRERKAQRLARLLVDLGYVTRVWLRGGGRNGASIAGVRYDYPPLNSDSD